MVVVEVSSSEVVVVESGWKVVVEISVVVEAVVKDVVVGVVDVVGAVVVVVEVVVKGSFLITLSKVALEDICSPC